MTSSLDFPLRLDPFECRMLVMVVIVVAVGAFIATFVSLRRARLIEDTPTSRIRSAAQAYVELEGEAVMMEGVPIIAPRTLLPCAWFRYRVEERVENNRGDARWRRPRATSGTATHPHRRQCIEIKPYGVTVAAIVTARNASTPAAISPPSANSAAPVVPRGRRTRMRCVRCSRSGSEIGLRCWPVSTTTG